MDSSVHGHGSVDQPLKYDPNQGQSEVTGTADTALLSIHQDMVSQSDAAKEHRDKLGDQIGTPDSPVLKPTYHNEWQTQTVIKHGLPVQERVKVRIQDSLPPGVQRAIYTGQSSEGLDALKGQIATTSQLGGMAAAAKAIMPDPEVYHNALGGRDPGAVTDKSIKKAKKDAKKKGAAKDPPAEPGSAAWLYVRTKAAADAAAAEKAKADKLKAKQEAKAHKHHPQQQVGVANIGGGAVPASGVKGPGGTQGTSGVSGVEDKPFETAGKPGPLPVDATPSAINNKLLNNSLTATQNTTRIIQAQVGVMATTNATAGSISAFLAAISSAIDNLKQFLGWLAKADLKTHMGQNKNAGSDQAQVAYHKIKEQIDKLNAMKTLCAVLGFLSFILGPILHIIIFEIQKAIIANLMHMKRPGGDIAMELFMPGVSQLTAITDLLKIGQPDPNADPYMDYHYGSGGDNSGDKGKSSSEKGGNPTQSIQSYTQQQISQSSYSPDGASTPHSNAVAAAIDPHTEATAMGLTGAVGAMVTAACMGSQGLALTSMAGAVMNGTNNMLNGTRNDPMLAYLGTHGKGAPPGESTATPGTAASLLENIPTVGNQMVAAGDDLNSRLAVGAAAFGASALPAAYLGSTGFTIAAAAVLAVTGATIKDKNGKSAFEGIAGPSGAPQNSAGSQGSSYAVAVASAAAARKIAKDNNATEDVAELIAQITKLLALLMAILNAAKGGGGAGGQINTETMISSIQKLVEANVGGESMKAALDAGLKGDQEGMIDSLTKSFSTAGMDPATLASMAKAVMGDFNVQGVQPPAMTGTSYNPMAA